MRYHPLRWIAAGVFVVSSTLNYLDRSLLTVLAPLIITEFGFSNQQFGWLISAFSVTYALASLPAGWGLDRLGTNRGISIAAGLWSAASVSTGLVGSGTTMALCRGALGVGEAAGVPAFGKVNADYLKPEERALGAAVNGVGISVGVALAPLWIGVATSYGWRGPFVISGIFGFLWIPLWLLVSRSISPRRASVASQSMRRDSDWPLLRRKPLLSLMAANVLWMSGYSLWSNWITLYLMQVHHVTLQGTKALVWIPPIVSNLGGFFGGWLSLRWAKQGILTVDARKRAIWWSAAGCLSALGLLAVHSAAGATVFIAMSFFFVLAGSVNLYALPIDLYGAERAGFAVSALTCAYGILQAVISPAIGWMADHRLYQGPVWMVAIAPVLACLVLTRVRVQESMQF